MLAGAAAIGARPRPGRDLRGSVLGFGCAEVTEAGRHGQRGRVPAVAGRRGTRPAGAARRTGQPARALALAASSTPRGILPPEHHDQVLAPGPICPPETPDHREGHSACAYRHPARGAPRDHEQRLSQSDESPAAPVRPAARSARAGQEGGPVRAPSRRPVGYRIWPRISPPGKSPGPGVGRRHPVVGVHVDVGVAAVHCGQDRCEVGPSAGVANVPGGDGSRGQRAVGRAGRGPPNRVTRTGPLTPKAPHGLGLWGRPGRVPPAGQAVPITDGRNWNSGGRRPAIPLA